MTSPTSTLFHVTSLPVVDGWLHPLNELKRTNQPLYDHYVQKYHGREYIRQRRIPILNCEWSDVVFLSAVNPQVVVETIRQLGGQSSPLRYYELSGHSFESDKCLIWLYEQEDYTDLSQYVQFTPSLIARYSALPDRAVEYYRATIASQKPTLLYQFVPHFLYRGSIWVGNQNVLSTETSDSATN